MKQRIQDRRKFPFFQVTKADVAALVAATDRPEVTVKLSSVRSVYFALLEITNDERSDTAEVTKAELGARSGVSTRTVYDTVQVLEAAGLLELEKRDGYADAWVLVSVEDTSATTAEGVGNGCRGGRQPLPGSYRESQEVENENPLPPEGVTAGPDPVERIFEFWKKVMKHPRAKLEGKRRRVIAAALKDSTPDECAQAIRGCYKSDFHMARGQYRGHTPHHELSLILRSREKIEWFGGLAPQTAYPDSRGALDSSVDDAKIREHKLNVRTAHDLAGSGDAKRRSDESEKWLELHGVRVVRDPDGRPTFEAATEPGGHGVLEAPGEGEGQGDA